MNKAALYLAGLAAAALAASCKPVRAPGRQVGELRSVLLDTTDFDFGVGPPGRLTLPHGSRDTRFAAVLVVGDWSSRSHEDEKPGSESVLREIAEGLGQDAFACLRITDWGPPATPTRRIEAAWDALRRIPVVDPARTALVVQGSAAYFAFPLVAKLRPNAVVALGPPGRPFRELATARMKLALRSGDGSDDPGTARDELARWLQGGKSPLGPWAQRAFGDAPLGYYSPALDVDPVKSLPRGIPALVLRGEDDPWTEAVDARRVATALGVEPVTLPLADHRGKAAGPGVRVDPSDPVVPEVVELIVELLEPLLQPKDLRAG